MKIVNFLKANYRKKKNTGTLIYIQVINFWKQLHPTKQLLKETSS